MQHHVDKIHITKTISKKLIILSDSHESYCKFVMMMHLNSRNNKKEKNDINPIDGLCQIEGSYQRP